MLRKVENPAPSAPRIIRPFLRERSALRHGENQRATATLAEQAGLRRELSLSRWQLHPEGSFERDVSKLALVDLERALRVTLWIRSALAVNFSEKPCVAVAVKHGVPCGVGVGDTPVVATLGMIEGHPGALLGASVVTTFAVDEVIADLLRNHWRRLVKRKRMIAGVAAPEISHGAAETLRRKERQVVLLENPILSELGPEHIPREPVYTHLPILGSFVTEEADTFILDLNDKRIRIETDCPHRLTDDVRRDLVIAWAVCAKTKSNAASIVQGGQLLGNAASAVDRVGACRLAGSMLAEDSLHGRPKIVAATDSFFPFPDGLAELHGSSVEFVFATQGGLRYREVAEYARTKMMTLVWLDDQVARGFDH